MAALVSSILKKDLILIFDVKFSCNPGWPWSHYVAENDHKLLILLSPNTEITGLYPYRWVLLTNAPAGRWWCTTLIPASGGRGGLILCEFKASLVYRVSSSIDSKAAQRNPVSKNKSTFKIFIWCVCVWERERETRTTATMWMSKYNCRSWFSHCVSSGDWIHVIFW